MSGSALPAGDFGAWLATMSAALETGGPSDVPCGSCTACCTSSQFIHIEPDETDALRHIPKALLFPAPRLPRGNVLLGFNERGHCPMLVNDACSIYDHRPRTCRTYDCRVFPATGLVPDDKPLIAAQAVRWQFDHATDHDRAQHDALRSAAASLAGGPETPPTATQQAVLAIRRFTHDPSVD
jgi:uncharacterized protein